MADEVKKLTDQWRAVCREVLQTLPMEFAVEAQKLVGISLEGSVG